MLTLEHLLQDRQQDAIFLPANILATGIPNESPPRDLPAPSIGAEPDGALTMEWYGSVAEIPQPILDLIRRVYAE